jgi:hypothetical protein
MKTLWQIARLLLCAFLLTACGNSSELTWTEDVKLPDGRVLTLTRWVEFKGPHGLGGRSTESSQQLEFKHPETGETVKWQSSMEQGLLKTISLWLEHGRPLLLGEPAYGGDSHKFYCPNPPYLLYEYVGGQWRSKPLTQIPVKRIRANVTTHLLEMRQEIENNKRHLTAAQTSDSHTYVHGVHRAPYVIQFEGMPDQTFKAQNCDLGPDINELIFVEGK